MALQKADCGARERMNKLRTQKTSFHVLRSSRRWPARFPLGSRSSAAAFVARRLTETAASTVLRNDDNNNDDIEE